MNEKISDAEIDKLRAVVGENSDFETTGWSTEINPSNNTSAINKSIMTKPVPEKPERKDFERPSTATSSMDTELFVKVEEHAAIGSILSDAKGNMKSIADTIALLAKAEKLKSEAISRMEEALDKIDDRILDVEAKLVTPENLRASDSSISEVAVSDDLTDLRSELDSLKSELGKINK